MKKAICFLISISILLLSTTLKAEVPEQSKFISHRIEKSFWYAKGGKIELKSGTWRFGVRDADYTFFCVFTLVNNSTASYRINPSIMLLDGDRATVLRIPPAKYFGKGKKYEEFRRRYDKIRPFKPKILKPREGYVFEDSFPVLREMVSGVGRIKLEVAFEEIK